MTVVTAVSDNVTSSHPWNWELSYSWGRGWGDECPPPGVLDKVLKLCLWGLQQIPGLGLVISLASPHDWVGELGLS